jgi:hypothetical protein
LRVPARVGEDLIDAGLVLCGPPATGREQVVEQLRTTGVRQLSLWLAFRNLTHGQVTRSMELFGREVIPAVRGLSA